jgi:DNA modification methylase
MLPRNTILVGHVMDRLRELPDRSVQCVVTSPPYWGLRVYGIEPQVWGGEAGCPHEFKEALVDAVTGAKGNWQQADNGTSHKTRFRGDVDAARQETTVAVRQGTCRLCGAWLGDFGLEPTFDLYLAHLVAVFREVRRVLRDDGLLWLNMGDCYAGSGKGRNADGTHGAKAGEKQLTNRGAILGVLPEMTDDLKAKNLYGMPWRVAFALQADGWWVRSDTIEEVEFYCPCGCGHVMEERVWRWSQDAEVIWSKPNSMPESAKDRPTKSHEYIFMLSKSARYFSDMEAIKEEVSASTGRYPYKASMDEARPDPGLPNGDQPSRSSTPRVGVERSPAGWRTDKGAHGSIHPEGRESRVTYNSIDISRKNARSVWTIPTEPFACEYCRACKRFYWSAEYQALAKVKTENRESRVCRCGASDQWLSHFATFPQELVEKCLLASTSEAGACAACGAPWRRLTKKTYEDTDRQPAPNKGRTEAHGERAANMTGDGFIPNRIATVTQLGFERGCKCEGEPAKAPCVALDPFMGSGTVALVALRARRDFIGVELNPEYAEMAGHRIASERDQGRLL